MRIPLKASVWLIAFFAGLIFVFIWLEHAVAGNFAKVWWYNLLRYSAFSLAVVFVIVATWRWRVVRLVYELSSRLKAIRLGQTEEFYLPREPLLRPLTRELVYLVRSLQKARYAAEEEARLRQQGSAVWTEERLKELLRQKLRGAPIFMVSNREPYMHIKKAKVVECIMPASGVITGVEPVMKACGGTWVAHGAGEMDKEMVDAQDRVRVPPTEPVYTLRRVWLNKEEENGYYYGFSNEGLWPLCHIAHTRPIFREKDFRHYQAVNEKFAQALLEEIKETRSPLILVQDYHFALLPRLVKKARPDARIALFWHIPWPNPEAFGICPWQRELIYGMLGADLIGFHIQFHCNNFLETVERALESRIDRERFAVLHQGHTSFVKPFPISIPFKQPPADANPGTLLAAREQLLREHDIHAEFIGVGVDRLDYTKGIFERFLSIERFFEKYPSYLEKFTFIQLGAPSREHIERYRRFIDTIAAEADRINWKLQTKTWRPIVFLKGYHSHQEIEPYYQSASLCLVTSLHDGMNLVAKEFIHSRWDEDGVLILSQFAGASRELNAALLINPYDIEQVAEAIHYALEMDEEERTRRMRRLRNILQENNIYRWAASLISSLVQIRVEPVAAPSSAAKSSKST